MKNKKFIWLSGSVIVLIGTMLGILFIPMLYVDDYFKNNYSVGNIPFIQIVSFQSKRDLFNSKYTILLRLSAEDEKHGGYIYSVKRKNLIFWEIDENETIKIYTEGLTFEEFVKTAEENDLSENNPNPKNISINNSFLEQDEDNPALNPANSNEDVFFSKPTKYSEGEKNIEDFNNLKIGMNGKETLEIVGDYDRSISNYYGDNNISCHYAINKGGVNFVEIVFDKDPDYFPEDAKIQKVSIVYDDNRIEDLELDN